MNTDQLAIVYDQNTLRDGELIALVHASSLSSVEQWVRSMASVTNTHLEWEVTGSIRVLHVGDAVSRLHVLRAMCVFASELEAWGLPLIHDNGDYKKMEMIDLTKL